MLQKSFTLIAAVGLVAMSGAAEARTVTRHYTGAHGGVGQSTGTRTPGLRHRDSSFTGPAGRTRSLSDTRAWDRAAGNFAHDRTRTFADGTQRSVNTDAQRIAPGTFEVDRTVTQRDGDTRTRSGVVTR